MNPITHEIIRFLVDVHMIVAEMFVLAVFLAVGYDVVRRHIGPRR